MTIIILEEIFSFCLITEHKYIKLENNFTNYAIGNITLLTPNPGEITKYHDFSLSEFEIKKRIENYAAKIQN